jgi:hypothetical protein
MCGTGVRLHLVEMRDMRLKALVMAVGLTAAAAGAEDRKTSFGPDVVICMQQIGNPRIREASRIATRIFGDIGVRLEWRPSTGCPVAADAVHVSLSSEIPKEATTHALAYAFPTDGTRIVILQNRVEAISSGRFSLVLAYVLVHEITHIFQGSFRHSSEGIMKARWTRNEFCHITDHSLSFTDDDVDLIYDGLDSRFAKTPKVTRTGR